MSVQNETMQHLIAFNGFRGGNKGSASCQPLSEYDKTISLPWLHEMVLQIRGEKSIRSVDRADEAKIAKAQLRIKGQLPFRCAHYYRFLKNRRSQSNADPTAFLFQTTVDVDDKEYVEQAIERARELNCSDTIWKGMLLHLEYSARKKLHIDIRMPVGMTIEETQRAYCEASGIPYDKSCITPERIIFITDKDSEIYRSKDWYAVLPAEEISLRREAFLKRGLTIDGRGNENFPQRINSSEGSNVFKSNQNVQDNRFQGTNGDNAVYAGAAFQPAQPGDSHRVNDSHLSPAGDNQNAGGVAIQEASEKNLIAFELFKEAAGLQGMDIDTIGSRHSSLLAIMSAGASRVMGEDELMKVVAKKMPSYYGERDCHQLIHDFYAKYGDSSKPFSRDVIRINATAEKQAIQQVDSLQFKVKSSNLNAQGNDGEDEYPPAPPMPQKLPKLVELLVSQTPDIYKPAVACAIFPPLATHLWKTRFRYIDNVEHEATLMCCLLAGTGAGKSCVQMPISLIMEDIRKRDMENLQREKEWKDELMRKGANKDKRKRPDNLIIQEIDADMTNPAFVMRTAEAKEHFLYTSLNEIDQFDALRGIGNQHFRIMCLAFDPGNIYGQTRVGLQSVTERVTIRFNWNASTTIEKGQRYFSKVLTDGPLSRINFCTIPEREIGERVPVYGNYDDQFRKELKPYIENLCAATGLIECPEAYALADKLSEENADFSQVMQNRIYENFTFRANVIAYLKACVLYVANGYRWEEEIEDFIRWSERYDLWCKMRFFEEDIRNSANRGEHSNKRGPSNLLQALPDMFTEQQVVDARNALGLPKEGTAHLLATWVYRKYIRRGSNDSHNNSYHSFTKLKYRRDGLDLS